MDKLAFLVISCIDFLINFYLGEKIFLLNKIINIFHTGARTCGAQTQRHTTRNRQPGRHKCTELSFCVVFAPDCNFIEKGRTWRHFSKYMVQVNVEAAKGERAYAIEWYK